MKINASTRRQFIKHASTAVAAFTIVPRHVLGGPQFVAPSDKITMAYIGVGTQGLRELMLNNRQGVLAQVLRSGNIQVGDAITERKT